MSARAEGIHRKVSRKPRKRSRVDPSPKKEPSMSEQNKAAARRVFEAFARATSTRSTS